MTGHVQRTNGDAPGTAAGDGHVDVRGSGEEANGDGAGCETGDAVETGLGTGQGLAALKLEERLLLLHALCEQVHT